MLLFSLLTTSLLAGAAPAAEQCTPMRDGNAAPIIARAIDVTGLSRLGNAVLRANVAESQVHGEQSDRTYPPFFSDMSTSALWTDPARGTERVERQFFWIGSGPMNQGAVLSSEQATFVARDTVLMPAQPWHGRTAASRPLNAWAVLRDWERASDAHVVARCVYRDYPRTVLAREGAYGEERLYLDPKTGFPVKLERREPHYLWGDVRVEYVYSTWQVAGGAAYPGASFRLEDGDVATSRTVGTMALVPRDSAPRLALPADAPVMALPNPFVEPTPPDTVRVGPNAFLLVTRAYTSAVALVGDTVYVLDATLGEARARQDSLWVGRLFPGKHPVALVVTDLAWPHIAGVRFWVASGATVISHRASREFLARVIDRRWTLAPDRLEQRRRTAKLRFVAVNDSLALAGGAIRLHAIDGVSSEGALMAYLSGDRFLYAGDFIQDTQNPSQYASEVSRAVRRAGVTPQRVAAMHIPLTAWEKIAALVGDN